MFEHWLNTDVTSLPKVAHIPGIAFRLDEDAYKLGVNVFDDGDALSLSGDVEGWIIKNDGSSMKIDGERDGNQAWIVLPDDACDTLGKISIFIKVVIGDEVITLGGFETVIYPSQTNNIIN